jgi:MFS family permease
MFFLHERGRCMMIQQTIQTILTAVFVIFAGPIAEAISPEWWYGLGAILSAVSLVAAFFFVPETKYHRPKSSFQSGGSSDDEAVIVVCTERPALDYVNFAPRTWRSDLRLWVGAPEWNKIIEIFTVSVAVLSSFTVSRSTNIC